MLKSNGCDPNVIGRNGSSRFLQAIENIGIKFSRIFINSIQTHSRSIQKFFQFRSVFVLQAVRLMRIERQLEDMVNAAISPSQAQNKVDAFLKRRMLYLYPDLSQYEQQAVHQQAAELLASPPKTEKPQSEAGEVATCRTKSWPIRTTQQNSSSCAATTELISSSRRYSAVPNAM